MQTISFPPFQTQSKPQDQKLSAEGIIKAQYWQHQYQLKSQLEQQLNFKLEESNKELSILNEQILDYEQKYKNYKNQSEAIKSDLEQKILQLQSDLGDAEMKIYTTDNKKKNLDQEVMLLKTQIQYLKDQVEDAQEQSIMSSRAIPQKQISQNNNSVNQLFNQINDMSSRISEKDTEIGSLKQEINKLNLKLRQYESQQGQNMLSLQNELEEKRHEAEKEHRYHMEARDEIAELKKQITKYKQDLNVREEDKRNLQSLMGIKEQKSKCELETLEKKYAFEMELKNNQILKLQEIQVYLEEQMKNQRANLTQSVIDNQKKQYEKIKQQQQQLEEEIERKKQKQFEQIDKENIEFQKKIYIKKEKDRQDKADQTGKIVQEAAKNRGLARQTHGQLDVCFLLDVTYSMEPYKVQARDCIKKSLTVIKEATGRDTNWGAVCYSDFGEKEKKGGKYDQFDFTKETAQLQKWLDTEVKVQNGNDIAEDIRGAMKQMCQMNWPNRFKIAILICDSPCHGEKYNGGCGDYHKNEDIIDAIEEMISKNIILIGLNFTKLTTTMYKEIQKIYIEKKKEDLFMYSDLQNQKIESAGAAMSTWLGKASENATKINSKQTFSKSNDQQPAVERSKDGAMEALCRQGNFQNFYNFENQQNIKTVQVQFKVLRVELKQDEFTQKIQNISQIQVPNDFQIDVVSNWNCLRTEKPFAFGMMKDVFLMKKVGCDSELYVIKTPIGSKPYATRNEAIAECRSHLICQQLMKKFNQELQSGLEASYSQKKFPEVVYSDFLILEESPTLYWIAERFFEGEFIKYNNNYGYINDLPTDYNKIAQAFTYYTYLISGFNYIVNDIQGVDKYFTDPAINTNQGKFDPTDMGTDGIAMYLVNYELKKELLAKELLQILGYWDNQQY